MFCVSRLPAHEALTGPEALGTVGANIGCALGVHPTSLAVYRTSVPITCSHLPVRGRSRQHPLRAQGRRPVNARNRSRKGAYSETGTGSRKIPNERHISADGAVPTHIARESSSESGHSTPI